MYVSTRCLAMILTIWLSALSIPSTLADSSADYNAVNASPALMKLLKIAPAASAAISDSLRLSARIELDQRQMARIGSAVTGRITEIAAVLGDSVRKGQRLALLSSQELGKAESDYLKAASQVNLHRLSVARARRLLESDVIAPAQLEERQGMLNVAEVDLHTAADQLRLMGMSEADIRHLDKERQIHSMSPVIASIDGEVIERNITLGQVVQPADDLYTIADLSSLWLVAEVPEQQAHWAREGDRVEAEIPALPGQEVSGKLIYVANVVNPETRTVTVRMTLDNHQRLFKPQMLATLKIKKSADRVLVIPSRAVVRDRDLDYVFVQTEATRFELRHVELGDEEDELRPVLTGLKKGEPVVIDGAFYLNNERLRTDME